MKVHVPRHVSIRVMLGVTLTSILLVSAVLYYVWAATPTSTFWISPGVYPGAPSYTVWREGSSYFAKTANGELAYSGSNATILIQDCIDDLTTEVVGAPATIQLQNGQYSLGDVGLMLGLNNDRLTISGGGDSTRFDYTGTGYAITLDGTGGNLQNVRLSGFWIDTDAGGINLNNYVYYCDVDYVSVYGDDGVSDVGILLNGTDCYWNDVVSCYIRHIGIGIKIDNEANANKILGTTIRNVGTGMIVDNSLGCQMVSGYIEGFDTGCFINANHSSFIGVGMESTGATKTAYNITANAYHTEIIGGWLNVGGSWIYDKGQNTVSLLQSYYVQLPQMPHPNTAAWTTSNTGRFWYCTTHSQVEYWNGTHVLSVNATVVP